MEQESFKVAAIALGLGLLVGLQREHANSRIAGIRTFPLITLTGTVAGLLARSMGGWIVAAGFLCITALVIMANFLKQDGRPDSGQTTEAAVLLMYGLGAYLTTGDQTLAIALGGLVAVLLHLKDPLHGLVDRIGYKDLKVVMQFVLISLVILPVLPNATYGPLEVLNPHDIWMMVVLIVGISMCGYFAYKFFGQGAGTLLGGILGGLISSTATTVSYARRTKKAPDASMLATFVILTASTVAFIRMLVEIFVVAPGWFLQLGPPLGAVLALMVLLIVGLYFQTRRQSEKVEIPEQENPAQLKSALIFAGLYGLVILASALAREHFGRSGLYAVAFLSGLTDVDAITLSTAKMVNQSQVSVTTGWRLMLTAALSNLVFKGAMVGVLGAGKLFYRIAVLFGLTLAGGLLVLWLWPASG